MIKCKTHKMDDRGYCEVCGHTSHYYRAKARRAAEYRWMEAELKADDEMMHRHKRSKHESQCH